MSATTHTLEQLEVLLEHAKQVLASAGVEMLRIRWSESLDQATSVEIDDPNLQYLERSIRPGCHAFFWWDEIAVDGSDDGERVVLRIALWQDGLVYEWHLHTARWFEWVRETERHQEAQETARLIARQGATLHPNQQALADRLMANPDAVLAEFVDGAMAEVGPNDLHQPHQYYLIQAGERATGIRDLPSDCEARAVANQIIGRATLAIKDRFRSKAEEAAEQLAGSFDEWHFSNGRPRITKALVKRYVQESGYQAPAHFSDDLKVRIDLMQARAA